MWEEGISRGDDRKRIKQPPEMTDLSDAMHNLRPCEYCTYFRLSSPARARNRLIASFAVDSQPPDVTHNAAQSRRLTAADRVNRYHQSRQSSASDDSMGESFETRGPFCISSLQLHSFASCNSPHFFFFFLRSSNRNRLPRPDCATLHFRGGRAILRWSTFIINFLSANSFNARLADCPSDPPIFHSITFN